MQARRQPQLFLTEPCKLQRFLRRAAACSPRHGNEEGAQGTGHAVEACAEVGGPGGSFGGEEFEGEVRGVGREGGDFVGYFFGVVIG